MSFLKNCFIWHVPLNLVARLPVSHVFFAVSHFSRTRKHVQDNKTKVKVEGIYKVYKIGNSGDCMSQAF